MNVSIRVCDLSWMVVRAAARLGTLFRRSWRLPVVALALLLGGQSAVQAAPAKVIAGAYINKVQEVSFKDSHYTVDFYIWFRWKAEGALADYKPLESFEVINGRVDSRSSVVEKKIGDVQYASARISATIFQSFELGNFPFDSHHVAIFIEDSAHTAGELAFETDAANSRLGDEISLPGWVISGFEVKTLDKTYRTNYGDISLPTNAQSSYSRLSVAMDMKRDGAGSAVKLLSTVLAATLVAFVTFCIKPTDVDPRFGLGVGALFAVAASAFVVASAVPDSSLLTIADKMHMLAMGFIFASLVQSALMLAWDESGSEELALRVKKVDRICLVLFPVAFILASLWAMRHVFA